MLGEVRGAQPFKLLLSLIIVAEEMYAYLN